VPVSAHAKSLITQVSDVSALASCQSLHTLDIRRTQGVCMLGCMSTSTIEDDGDTSSEGSAAAVMPVSDDEVDLIHICCRGRVFTRWLLGICLL
jgi:hypothetical protein